MEKNFKIKALSSSFNPITKNDINAVKKSKTFGHLMTGKKFVSFNDTVSMDGGMEDDFSGNAAYEVFAKALKFPYSRVSDEDYKHEFDNIEVENKAMFGPEMGVISGKADGRDFVLIFYFSGVYDDEIKALWKKDFDDYINGLMEMDEELFLVMECALYM